MDTPGLQYALTSDHVSIAYLTLGHGLPVVFACNIWGDAHLYSSAEPYIRKLADSLVNHDWQVHLYDGRGMGSSDRAPSDFSLEARQRDLAAVVDMLGLERFVLAAYDIAGPTAIAYVAEAPVRVAGLVLLNANASTTLRRQASPALRNLRSPVVWTQEDWEFRTLTLASVDTRFSDAAKAQEVAAIFRAGMSREAFLAYVQANASLEVDNLLAPISTPTLVIFDKTGPFGAFESCQALAARIPQARLVTTSDAPLTMHEFLAPTFAAADELQNAKSQANRDGLSSREVEVLRLVAIGKSNQQIADELVISANTVARHVSHIFDKIGVDNRVQATAYAHRHALL
jgi:DNA-binding CsgD family transcriptional regulator/pimeloyl-ACP methyl ester carboxylesterase